MIILKKKKEEEFIPMTELEIQEIENRIVNKATQSLKILPRPIRRQLSRMKDDVLRIWKMDSVYSGEIQLLISKTYSNSALTIDVLEALIKKENGKVKFERFLKQAVSYAAKFRKKEQKNN